MQSLVNEAEVELKGVSGVQIIQETGNVVSLSKRLLHSVLNITALLLGDRFEDVEERVFTLALDYHFCFTCPLVLNGLPGSLFGQIKVCFPVDFGALNLVGPVGVVVGEGSKRENLVLEELVSFEGHSDGHLWLGKLLMFAVKLSKVREDSVIAIVDELLDHGVVLDGFDPEVSDTIAAKFQMVDVDDLVIHFIPLFSGPLLIRLHNTGNSLLKLGVSLVELGCISFEFSQVTSNDLVSLQEERDLTLLEGFR